MKKIIITFWALLIFPNLFGQIKVTWESIKTINPTTISVKVFVQNFGQRVALWNKYGEAYYNGQEELNFSVEYDDIQTGKHIVLPPASITIKTIFGGSIAMTTPVYYFDPTGTDSGERWEIIYILPEESENVVVKVLGEKKFIGDMPYAEKARQANFAKFLKEKDYKYYHYEAFHAKEYFKIYDKIIDIIEKNYKQQENNIVTGKIIFLIDTLGVTRFKSELSSNELNNILKNKIGNINLTPCQHQDYKLLAKAEYDILLADGITKIKISNGKIKKVKPQIENNLLLKLLLNKIGYSNEYRLTEWSGSYKIHYNILLINNELTPKSEINSTQVDFGYILDKL